MEGIVIREPAGPQGSSGGGLIYTATCTDINERCRGAFELGSVYEWLGSQEIVRLSDFCRPILVDLG